MLNDYNAVFVVLVLSLTISTAQSEPQVKVKLIYGLKSLLKCKDSDVSYQNRVLMSLTFWFTLPK